MSQVMFSITSEVTRVSGVSSIGKENLMMLNAYRGPLLIHPRWYKLPLDTYRDNDSSVVPSGGEEHDARDMIRIYKNTKREDAMEFGDP